MHTPICIPSPSFLCLSLNVSVNQSVSCFCVWGGNDERSSKPPFLSMTNGKIHFIQLFPFILPPPPPLSFCQSGFWGTLSLPYFILLVSLSFPNYLRLPVCLSLSLTGFAVTLGQSQIEASAEPSHSLLSVTIHLERWGAQLMS